MEKLNFSKHIFTPNYDFLPANEKMMVILSGRGVAEKSNRMWKQVFKWLLIIGFICIFVTLKIKGA